MLFLSPPAQRVRELDGCSFVDEVMMSDVYYDNNAYSLSMMDHWLRSRDDIWYAPFIRCSTHHVPP